MLNSLRWKLVAIYFVSALSVVLLLMTGTYLLLSHYFITQTDLALQYKMAGEFRKLQMPLPAELLNAEITWQQQNPGTILHATSMAYFPSPNALAPTVTITPGQTPTSRIVYVPGKSDDDDAEVVELIPSIIPTISPIQPALESEAEDEAEDEVEDEERFDNRLSSIFIVPTRGPISQSPTTSPSAPINEDREAAGQAILTGYDYRTVQLNDGARIRLLTYRTESLEETSVIQLGTLLENQDHVLSQYLIGLTLLGIGASILVALISWLLASRAIQPAQKAWDQQQVFIANASHELRTPLAIIRASAEMGIRSKTRSDQPEALRSIVSVTDHMGTLVEDLLFLSRMDSHQIRVHKEPVALQAILAEVQNQMAGILDQHGAQIAVEPSTAMVVADRTRLKQVLLILLDNALRHNEHGNCIEVSTIKVGKAYEVRIRDHGTGIPPEHLAYIFDRFYQVPSVDYEERGAGLGLSIAKELVKAQGGRIYALSEVGKGTTIVISLPAV